MAQTGFTPIQLYSSSTPASAPAAGNLTNDTKGSELAVNIADGKLFYKDTSNNVQTLADKTWVGTVTNVSALTIGTTGTDLSSTVANPTSTPVITLNVPTASAVNRGALSAADWSTFNSKAPGVTFTSNYIPFGQGTTTLNQSAALTFDGTNFATTGAATAARFIPSGSTVPTNGMYLPAANSLGLSTNSATALYIGSAQNVTIGSAAPTAGQTLNASKAVTGSTNSMGIRSTGTVQSDVTSSARGFDSGMGTAAASFTLTNLIHYYAAPAAFGAGSTVTTQIGYYSETNLTGATTNYGFLAGNTAGVTAGKTNFAFFANNNIATGGGTTWNFYANGTAPNFMEGTLQCKTTIGVGNATPSTSGAGITFPATASASSNANTLDDYEEGTWTPGYAFGTPGTSAFTYTGGRLGTYVKVGNLVSCFFYLDNVTIVKGTASGSLNVTGLPFTVAGNTDYSGGVVTLTDSYPIGPQAFLTFTGTTTVGMRTAGGAATITAADFAASNTVFLRGVIQYLVS
jgi:hypothetical protein